MASGEVIESSSGRFVVALLLTGLSVVICSAVHSGALLLDSLRIIISQLIFRFSRSFSSFV